GIPVSRWSSRIGASKACTGSENSTRSRESGERPRSIGNMDSATVSTSRRPISVRASRRNGNESRTWCARASGSPTPSRGSARTRRRNTTLPSTSPSPERDAFLVLVRSRASLVGLRGGRVEGQEDDLSEPLTDRQLKGLGRRVEGAEGEGPGETRVDDPERCD